MIINFIKKFPFLKSRMKLIDKWSFKKQEKPKLFIADCGSAISEVLVEITNQAIASKKTVFYINSYHDINCVRKIFTAANASERGENFYVNNCEFSNGNSIDDIQIELERIPSELIISNRAILCTLIPVLERSSNEIITMSTCVLTSILDVINSSENKNSIVIVIDGFEYYGEGVQKSLIDLAHKGVNVFVKTSSKGLQKNSFDLAMFDICLMRTQLKLTDFTFLSNKGITQNQIDDLDLLEGLELNHKENKPTLVKFSVRNITGTTFICASQRRKKILNNAKLLDELNKLNREEKTHRIALSLITSTPINMLTEIVKLPVSSVLNNANVNMMELESSLGELTQVGSECINGNFQNSNAILQNVWLMDGGDTIMFRICPGLLRKIFDVTT